MRSYLFMACATATAAAITVCAAPVSAQTRTALHAAVEQQNGDSVQALLATPEGLRLLEARDTQGRTALLLATLLGRSALAESLVAAGADVNAQDHQRDSAYLVAGARGNLPILRLTLEAIILSDGGPAHQDIVRQLIAAGADVNLPDGAGVTPLRHAEQRGYGAIAALLRAAGGR